jgi:hypothetical protein
MPTAHRDHSKWLPQTPQGRRARLIEEMAEVMINHSKAERFGLDTRYDWDKHAETTDTNWESNREALLRELGDLKSAIEAVERDLQT